MQRVFLTSGNLSEINENGGAKYFIIESDVLLTADVKFAKGSVLEFRGGSFGINTQYVSHANINLNESQVEALAYGIFPKTVTVSNFSNDLVRAEWFNDITSSEGDEIFINRALVAANGCPVTLEHRDYTLKGSIKFPDLGIRKPQTLVSPGVLKLSEESNGAAAILVNTHLITLKVNTIRGYRTSVTNKSGIIGGGIVTPPPVIGPVDPNPSTPTIPNGTGIRFNGNCYNCNVQVELMYDLNKAFDFSPETKMNDDGTPNNGGIQYCRIAFQNIMSTTYGIYVDVFKYNYRGENNINEKDGKYNLLNWFNENRILGGKLGADYGIYFVPKPDDIHAVNGCSDGLVFENIGLEGISKTAMRLCNITQSKFINLRMMESLPKDNPWIELQDVSFTDISIKGNIVPNRIQLGNGNRGVILNGWVMDDYSGGHSRFNRMAVMPYGSRALLKDEETGEKYYEPQAQSLTAYSSIVPFDMARTIEANGKASGTNYVETTFDIMAMCPGLMNKNDDTDKTYPHKVRPSTLNVSVAKMNIMNLDFRGLRDFGPSFVDINATIEESGKLVIKSDKYIRWEDTSNESISYTFTRSGLYRLTWDMNWNLSVTEVVTKDA